MWKDAPMAKPGTGLDMAEEDAWEETDDMTGEEVWLGARDAGADA